MYADDISLACDTAEKLRVAVTSMDATFLRWGLTINTKKTKVLVVGRNAAAQAAESVITLRGDQLEVSHSLSTWAGFSPQTALWTLR